MTWPPYQLAGSGGTGLARAPRPTVDDVNVASIRIIDELHGKPTNYSWIPVG